MFQLPTQIIVSFGHSENIFLKRKNVGKNKATIFENYGSLCLTLNAGRTCPHGKTSSLSHTWKNFPKGKASLDFGKLSKLSFDVESVENLTLECIFLIATGNLKTI